MNNFGFVSYANSFEELIELHACGAKEIILSSIELSRFGRLTRPQLIELALRARQLNLKTVLEWDILMTEPKLNRAKQVIKELDLTLFNTIRVQDVGALNFALNHLNHPIQLNLETGNHNLIGIGRWTELVGSRLEKIILSIELTAEKISEYTKAVNVPIEVVGLGPVLLLYTPRLLLSLEKNDLRWLKNDQSAIEHHIQALADSNENAHSGFRIIENLHGTFVIHYKDYCLLEKIPELRQMGVADIRIDLRQNISSKSIKPIADLVHKYSVSDIAQYIEKYEHKVTHCFYRANATDVLFKKLKNMNLQRSDAGYIGEVLEVSKNNYISVHLNGKKSEILVGNSYQIITPEGKSLPFTPHKISNLEGKNIVKASEDEIIIMPYQKSIVVKSLVYMN